MTLIELEPDRVSLEFAERELPTLLRRLRRYGRVIRLRYATLDVLTVRPDLSARPESFVLAIDFGESALISQTSAGDAILRELAAPHRRLTSSKWRRHFRNRQDADRLAA